MRTLEVEVQRKTQSCKGGHRCIVANPLPRTLAIRYSRRRVLSAIYHECQHKFGEGTATSWPHLLSL